MCFAIAISSSAHFAHGHARKVQTGLRQGTMPALWSMIAYLNCIEARTRRKIKHIFSPCSRRMICEGRFFRWENTQRRKYVRSHSTQVFLMPPAPIAKDYVLLAT